MVRPLILSITSKNMNFFLYMLYCIMELCVDVSEMIRKGIYKRLYGNEWEARLKKTLIRNVPSQLYFLGGGFWFVILLTPFTIAACLLERCCGIDLAMIIGAVVSLVTVSPYYIWRRKHYDELIANHEYVTGRPRYNRFQKIAAFIGYCGLFAIPMIALVVGTLLRK